MHCRNCAQQIDANAVVCVHCGVPPHLEKKFCPNCAQPTAPNQTLCTKCGVQIVPAFAGADKNRVTAALLAFFLGGFGAHKFYLGYNTEGIIILLVVWGGLVCFGVPTMIMGVVILIEAILYLTKTDQDFYQTYVLNRKGWF